jgi:hypothetical protein
MDNGTHNQERKPLAELVNIGVREDFTIMAHHPDGRDEHQYIYHEQGWGVLASQSILIEKGYTHFTFLFSAGKSADMNSFGSTLQNI